MKQLEFPQVSIIMPVRNESAYIENSLGSIFLQDYPSHLLEILMVDGASTDDTREKITRLSQKYPQYFVKVIENPQQYMPMGFNLGLRNANGEIIIMMGGHAELAPDYVTQCIKLLNEYPVACVGGAMETVAVGGISQAIAIAMSSPFGVGGVAFRTRPQHVMEVDTVVFAAYRRAVFEEIGYLDEEMIRNQDDEFNYRLRESGKKILFSPSIHSRYYSRSSFKALWRQYFQYGYWKVRVFQKHPLQMRPRQFVPLAFVLGLTVSVLLIFLGAGWALLMIILGLYLLANLGASLYLSVHHGWKNLKYLPLAFASLHLSYGYGFLFGLIRFIGRWQESNYPTFNTSHEIKTKPVVPPAD